MSRLNDRDYYIARAATSRDLAERATDPAIAKIHIEFASRYDVLAGQPEEKINGAQAIAQAT